MKTLNVIKTDLKKNNGKCGKCAFNNNFNSICVFVNCVSTERKDGEDVYFKLVDTDNKSE